MRDQREPLYSMSVACRLLGCHPQTLRLYERLELIKPHRQGKRRLYSEADLERARRIRHLTQDMGVNLAGVEVILRLLEEMQELHARFQLARGSLLRAVDQQRQRALTENPVLLLKSRADRSSALNRNGQG